MRNKVEDAPEEAGNKEKCRHHWIIESPQGPTSRGVCKFCGAEKEFRNSFRYSFREGTVPFPSESDSTKDINIDDEEADDS